MRRHVAINRRASERARRISASSISSGIIDGLSRVGAGFIMYSAHRAVAMFFVAACCEPWWMFRRAGCHPSRPAADLSYRRASISSQSSLLSSSVVDLLLLLASSQGCKSGFDFFSSNNFIFSSLWSKSSDSQLSKYCVVCEISWCRCQQLTALSISTALVTKLLVIDQLLQLALKFAVSALST